MKLKDRILETALRLFSGNGVKSVRMDDIATACGISKRTLYEVFIDREDLIRKSLDYSFMMFDKSINEQLGKSDNVVEDWWMALNRSSEFKAFNAPILNDLIKFYPHILKEFLTTHHDRILKMNKDRFLEGVEQGMLENNINIDKINDLLTNYFYSIQQDLSFNSLERCKRMDNELSNFAAVIFLRGLATEKGREYIDKHIWLEVNK